MPVGAWVPPPPNWLKKLPGHFKYYYLHEVTLGQSCADENKLEAEIRTMPAFKGAGSSEFRSSARELIVEYRREKAAILVLRVLLGQAAAAIGLTIAIVLAALAPSQFMAAVGAILVAGIGFIVGTLLVGLANVATVRRVSLRRALVAAMVACAIIAVRVMSATGGNILFVGACAAVVGVAGTYILATLINVLDSRYRRTMYVRKLRGAVLEALLDARHFATKHVREWGEPETTRAVQQRLRTASDLIRDYLPDRLSPVNRVERQDMQLGASAIADRMLYQPRLSTRKGRTELITFTTGAVQKVYREDWLDLPKRRRVQESNADRRWGSWVTGLRRFLAAFVPLIVVFVATTIGVPSDQLADYGYPVALLWLVVSVMSWLDPQFAQNTDVVRGLWSIFSPTRGEKSGDSKTGDEPRKPAA